MSELRVAGTFEPPSDGNADDPSPFAGEGRLTCEAGGLRLRGLEEQRHGLLTATPYLAVEVTPLGGLVVGGIAPGSSRAAGWATTPRPVRPALTEAGKSDRGAAP